MITDKKIVEVRCDNCQGHDEVVDADQFLVDNCWYIGYMYEDESKHFCSRGCLIEYFEEERDCKN